LRKTIVSSVEEINRLFGDDTADVNLYSPETADEKEAMAASHEERNFKE
jgi:hypothetical protein